MNVLERSAITSVVRLHLIDSNQTFKIIFKGLSGVIRLLWTACYSQNSIGQSLNTHKMTPLGTLAIISLGKTAHSADFRCIDPQMFPPFHRPPFSPKCNLRLT